MQTRITILMGTGLAILIIMWQLEPASYMYTRYIKSDGTVFVAVVAVKESSIHSSRSPTQ